MNFGKFGNNNEKHEVHPVEPVSETKEQSELIHTDPHVYMIPLSGKIDAQASTDIQNKALETITLTDCNKLIFDVNDVTYVSSAGMRMFATVSQAARSSGKQYELVQMREDILKIFQMTGYASAFAIKMKE